jgi:peptide/nickel transport system substrate-binding protein
MKSLLTSTLFAITATALLVSCSDTPEGKFTDGDSKGGDSSNSDKRYILNPKPDKWMDDWSKENTVVFHWRGEPDNLHPTNGTSNPRRMIQDYTQRFLLNIDLQTLELRPDLVTKMPDVSPDGLTYTYELKSGITWDDGSELTVDDVIFSMKAQTCPQVNNPAYKALFEYMQSISKDPSAPNKFNVVFKRRFVFNVAMFGDIAILQEKFHDKDGVLKKYTIEQFLDPEFIKTTHADLDAWAKEFNDPKYGRDINYLNGLGPYKVTAWEDKSRLELTRKKNHWSQKLTSPGYYDAAYPEKIICRVITDENAIALELKNQTIDATAWISTHGLFELQKDSSFNRNYHSAFVHNFDWQYLGFNMKPESVNRTPFFTDKNVRRAIAHLVPCDDMNQTYLDGQAVRMSSAVTPTRKDVYDPKLKPIAYDIEKAKQLLDAAGWKDTDGDNVRDKVINGKKVQFEFELMIMTGNVAGENMAKDIKESLYKAGVVAKIRSLEFATFYQQLPMHEFDMYFGAWSGSAFPEDYKQLWHSEQWANGGSNYVGFGSPKTDQLIDSIRVQIVDSLRHPMERELMSAIYDEQPYVFLFMVPRKIAIHKRFDNANMYWEKPGLYLPALRLWAPGVTINTAN